MKRLFEEEQSSKEDLKDEMKRLKAEYDQKLTSVENQYPAPVNFVSIDYSLIYFFVPSGLINVIPC